VRGAVSWDTWLDRGGPADYGRLGRRHVRADGNGAKILRTSDGNRQYSVRLKDLLRRGDVSANVEQPPRVAISGSSIVVIWSSKKSGSAAIRMARSSDAGRTYSPAMTIHDPALKGARGWESIAAGADDSVRVVWLDGSGRIRAAGQPLKPATHAGDELCRIPIARGLARVARAHRKEHRAAGRLQIDGDQRTLGKMKRDKRQRDVLTLRIANLTAPSQRRQPGSA
jgi:hypothetical protein